MVYWLLPQNTIYYCPGCSKNVASVGLFKNLVIDRINHEQNDYHCLAILRLQSPAKIRFDFLQKS